MKSVRYAVVAILMSSPCISFAVTPQVAARTNDGQKVDPDETWAQHWREDRDLLQKFQLADKANAEKLQRVFELEPKRFRRIAGGGFALTNHWLKMIRNPQASVFADAQIYYIGLQKKAYGKDRMTKEQANSLIERYSRWLQKYPKHKETASAQAEVESLKAAIAGGQAR